jgi:hypothetical protein
MPSTPAVATSEGSETLTASKPFADYPNCGNSARHGRSAAKVIKRCRTSEAKQKKMDGRCGHFSVAGQNRLMSGTANCRLRNRAGQSSCFVQRIIRRSIWEKTAELWFTDGKCPSLHPNIPIVAFFNILDSICHATRANHAGGSASSSFASPAAKTAGKSR